jgi:hypothetical protein
VLTLFNLIIALALKDWYVSSQSVDISLQETEDKTLEQRRKAMTWAQRLKWVFNIDVSTCSECGGEAKVIACIEDQQIIDKILAHLMKKGALPPPAELLPATRASPDSDWFA